MKSAALVITMSIVTALLRFLPLLGFRKHTSRYVSSQGKVVPPAIIGMLVIYCLKDVTLAVSPFGLPELTACAVVVGIQVWKRDALISILAGTVLYMVLVQVVF